MVLEQSNDEDDERGVDESEIQHIIGNLEMSQLYQHCFQAHRWKICQVPPSAHIELVGDKKIWYQREFFTVGECKTETVV